MFPFSPSYTNRESLDSPLFFPLFLDFSNLSSPQGHQPSACSLPHLGNISHCSRQTLENTTPPSLYISFWSFRMSQGVSRAQRLHPEVRDNFALQVKAGIPVWLGSQEQKHYIDSFPTGHGSPEDGFTGQGLLPHGVGKPSRRAALLADKVFVHPLWFGWHSLSHPGPGLLAPCVTVLTEPEPSGVWTGLQV